MPRAAPPCWPLLALALLLLPTAAGFAYVQTTGAQNLSAATLGYPSSASARAAAVAALVSAAFPSPQNVTLKCALINIFNVPGNAYTDGFSGFARPISPQLATALAALQPGTIMPLQRTDVDGFLVRVLLELETVIGFNVEFSVVTPSTNLLPPLTKATDGFLAYAFQEMNQTCSLWPSPASPARRLYSRQTIPVITYGYTVVTTRPQYILPTELQRIFFWTAPFSNGVWAILAGSILAAAIFMPFLEHGKNEQFGDDHRDLSLAGHSLYLAAMGPSMLDTFAPESAGGRAAVALHSFALLLIISSYTANLAAQLTTTSPPIQAVQSVDDIAGSLNMCSRYSTTLTTLLNSTQPDALATLTTNNTFELATLGAREAIVAMLAGNCAAAIVPTIDSNWIMNLNDTRGELCNAVPVGATFGEEAMPLTFSTTQFTPTQMEAVNSVITDLQRSGEFMLELTDTYFPEPPRAACAGLDDADAAAVLALSPASQLEPIDLAGAFMLQAIGLALGILLHITKELRKKAHSKVIKPLMVEPIKRLKTRRNGNAKDFGTDELGSPRDSNSEVARGDALVKLSGSEEA